MSTVSGRNVETKRLGLVPCVNIGDNGVDPAGGLELGTRGLRLASRE